MSPVSPSAPRALVLLGLLSLRLLCLSAEPGACSIPPNIPNAKPELNGLTSFPVDSTVTYKCDEGFVKIPGKSDSVVCLQHDKWSKLSEFCNRTCNVPPSLRFASLKKQFGKQNYFPVGSTVQYECRPGYRRENSLPAKLQCLQNLVWSSASEFCKRKSCQTPPQLAHGNVNVMTDILFGSIITFTCDKGYRLVGEQESECILKAKDVGWSVPHPECTAENSATTNGPAAQALPTTEQANATHAPAKQAPPTEQSSATSVLATPAPPAEQASTTNAPVKQVPPAQEASATNAPATAAPASEQGNAANAPATPAPPAEQSSATNAPATAAPASEQGNAENAPATPTPPAEQASATNAPATPAPPAEQASATNAPAKQVPPTEQASATNAPAKQVLPTEQVSATNAPATTVPSTTEQAKATNAPAKQAQPPTQQASITNAPITPTAPTTKRSTTTRSSTRIVTTVRSTTTASFHTTRPSSTKFRGKGTSSSGAVTNKYGNTFIILALLIMKLLTTD